MSLTGVHFCLYRYYDVADRLLYVGVTWDPNTRLGHHRSKPWHGDVAREERVWFADRMDAFLAERRATHAEAPLYPSDVDSSSAVSLAIGMVAGDLKRRGWTPDEARAKARRLVDVSGYPDGADQPRRSAVDDEEFFALGQAAMRDALDRLSDLIGYRPPALERARSAS